MPVIAVDEPSKGLRIQGRMVTKSSLSDDFWSTTTCDLDLAAIQSQKSGLSISSGGGGNTSIQPEFVNNGLLQWNQSRLKWVDHKKSTNRAKAKEHILRDATYESLLGNATNFPHPIPLSDEQRGVADSSLNLSINNIEACTTPVKPRTILAITSPFHRRKSGLLAQPLLTQNDACNYESIPQKKERLSMM